MGRTILRALFTLVCGAAIVGYSHAGVRHDSRIDWLTLQSEHFNIHYPEGYEPLARRTLAIAERIHDWLYIEIDWKPAERTEVVLTDEFDISNAYATFFPSNRMTVFLPGPDDINSVEDHAGWLESVVLHEYVHILHQDKGTGAVQGLRKVFGRFLFWFPNAFQPRWIIEGLATWHETDATRGIGRGQSSYYDMIMRMEVDSKLKPIQQVNQPLVSWPAGTAYYLYGVEFYEFVREKYGAESLRKWVDNYSNNVIPFRIISNSRQTFGSDLRQLWAAWEQHLNQRYTEQMQTIARSGVHAGEKLTDYGYYVGPLKALPDGRVYYINWDGRRRWKLNVRHPDGKRKRLRSVNFDTRLDVHPEAGIVIAQPQRCRNANVFYDLYRVNPDNGFARRLTRCKRYRQVTWSPDGTRLAAVQNGEGRNALHVLDNEGELLEVLWHGQPDEVVSHLDWAPDGKTIVASVFRPRGGWNLEQFDLQRRSWRALTGDTAIENHPVFSDDGSAVLFTADYGGIYNIRRLDLASGEISTLTNVRGGAFYPAMAGDSGGLHYVGYASDGFDIYRVAASPGSQAPQAVLATPEPVPGPTGVPLPPAPEVSTGDARRYSPWRSFAPRWWFPYLAFGSQRSELGATTSGWDTLERHTYSLTAAWDFTNNWFTGSFDYIYDRWFFLPKFHASSGVDLFLDADDNLQRARRNSEYILQVDFPLLRLEDHLTVYTGLVKNQDKDIEVADGVTPEPTFEDNLLGIGLGYDSTNIQPRSISRGGGREILVVAESSDVISGSNYTGEVYTLDYRELPRLWGESVLGLRLVQGWGTDRPRPFRLGGVGDVTFMPPVLGTAPANSPFNRRNYALRGYPEGLAQLQGRRMRIANLEYRFPIKRVERGYMVPPFGLHQMHAAVFVDTGAAWNEGSSPEEYFTGAGAEFTADTVLFYFVPLRLTVGYAHGFDLGGEDQGYLRLTASF